MNRTTKIVRKPSKYAPPLVLGLETETDTHSPGSGVASDAVSTLGTHGCIECSCRTILALSPSLLGPLSEFTHKTLSDAICAAALSAPRSTPASAMRSACATLKEIVSASRATSDGVLGGVSEAPKVALAAVHAMRGWPASEGVQAEAAALLRCTAARQEVWSSGMGRTGCVAALIAALHAHWGTQSVMREAFGALAAVARADITAVGEIEGDRRGAIPAAVSAMTSFPHDTELLHACCCFLRAVHSSPFLTASGGERASVVLAALADHPKCAPLVESALRIVAAIMHDIRRMAWPFASLRVADFLRPAVRALWDFGGSSRSTCHAANLAVMRLALRDQAAAVAAGAVEACMTSLGPGQSQACGTLWSLALNNASVQEVIASDDGILATVVGQAKNSEAIQCAFPCSLLWVVASTSEAARGAVQRAMGGMAAELACRDELVQEQRFLLDCVSRTQREAVARALECGACTAEASPFCPPPPECPAFVSSFPCRCSRPQWLVRCFTCDGDSSVHRVYCSSCAMLLHAGHRLSQSAFYPGNCRQSQPPSPQQQH